MTTRRDVVTARLLKALAERADRPNAYRTTTELARACAASRKQVDNLLRALLAEKRVTSTFHSIEHRATRVWWLR